MCVYIYIYIYTCYNIHNNKGTSRDRTGDLHIREGGSAPGDFERGRRGATPCTTCCGTRHGLRLCAAFPPPASAPARFVQRFPEVRWFAQLGGEGTI